jgi:hypothetical protein
MVVKLLIVVARISGAVLLLLGLVAILSSWLDADNTDLTLKIGGSALLVGSVLLFATRALARKP